MLAPLLTGEFNDFGERHQIAPIQAISRVQSAPL
jgi:hypothetical protein